MRWIVLVVVALVGCAPMKNTPKQKQYEKALHAWVGQDINRAIEMMGPPADVFKMPNGNAIYTWASEPSGEFYTSRLSRDRPDLKRCVTQFTTTPDGLVSAIKYAGRCGTGGS